MDGRSKCSCSDKTRLCLHFVAFGLIIALSLGAIIIGCVTGGFTPETGETREIYGTDELEQVKYNPIGEGNAGGIGISMGLLGGAGVIAGASQPLLSGTQKNFYPLLVLGMILLGGLGGFALAGTCGNWPYAFIGITVLGLCTWFRFSICSDVVGTKYYVGEPARILVNTFADKVILDENGVEQYVKDPRYNNGKKKFVKERKSKYKYDDDTELKHYTKVRVTGIDEHYVHVETIGDSKEDAGKTAKIPKRRTQNHQCNDLELGNGRVLQPDDGWGGNRWRRLVEDRNVFDESSIDSLLPYGGRLFLVLVIAPMALALTFMVWQTTQALEHDPKGVIHV